MLEPCVVKLDHGRGWLASFFGWHNDEHHHGSLALFTPAEVYFDRVEQVRAVRQAALDAAYAAYPERFAKGPPRVALPPTEVCINPLTSSAVAVAPPDGPPCSTTSGASP